MCAHRRSSGAKGNHLAETAGVWESAAIRQTSLAPADYLKARPPPGRLHPPLPPTISFPKSVARIIKLVEERRERGGEGERRKKRLLPSPPNLVRRATRPPSFRNLHAALYLDLSLHPLVFPLSAHFVPILRPFCLPPPSRALLSSLSLFPWCFFVLTWKFSQRN